MLDRMDVLGRACIASLLLGYILPLRPCDSMVLAYLHPILTVERYYANS